MLQVDWTICFVFCYFIAVGLENNIVNMSNSMKAPPPKKDSRMRIRAFPVRPEIVFYYESMKLLMIMMVYFQWLRQCIINIIYDGGGGCVLRTLNLI